MKNFFPGFLKLTAAIGAAVFCVALVNLFVDKPVNLAPETLEGKTALFQKAAPVIQESCFNCHSAKTQLPWYAQLPPAKQMIRHDMEEGLEELNMERELFTPGQAPSKKTLFKIKREVSGGAMPPLKYTALHWKAFLTPEKKKAILDWIGEEQKGRGEIFEPLPESVKVDERKAALGKMLFNDKRLSGDGTISCASCHDLSKGGTDQMAVSTGIHGQKGPISAPTVFNSHYNFVQFWDGRAANLKEQALGPVTNALEMGGDWKKILPVLNADAVYTAEFQAVYGRAATQDDIANAIAEFETTLVTPNSPFDRYLKGDAAALTEKQKLGFKLFKEVGCSSCHYGPALGGATFEKMGKRGDYFSDRGQLTDADWGRFNHTKNEEDKHFFKVPLLRNVALTYPYFHDGHAKTLNEAVDKMAHYQIGRRLTEEEAAAIVAYLQSLTGEYEGKPLSSIAETKELDAVK